MKNVPKLRFKNKNGNDFPSWEFSIIGDMITQKSGKYNPEKSKEVIKCIELEHLSQESGKLLGFTDASNQKSIKNKFQKGDVLFGKLRPYLKKFIKTTFDGVCSTEIWVLTGKKISNDFAFQFIQTENFISIANISSGSKMPRADWGLVASAVTKYPVLEEQTKIATFLTAIDDRISQLAERCSLLEQYKKAVMQQIFSQELRFKDEDGREFPAWEDKTLGDMFDHRTDRSIGNEILLSVTTRNGILKADDLDKKDSSSADKSKYLRVMEGDIAYNSMRMWQGASGVSLWNGIVSPAYTVLKPKSVTCALYFGFYFKFEPIIKIFEKNSQGLTSDTWNLKFKQLKKISFSIPSRPEQEKIAGFLAAVDDKIAVAKAKLEAVRQYKQGLLQQMFV